jgi:acyl carrier protein
VASLLGLDQLGIDDNFFTLGGNSMMGTQLIVLVAETFGIGLPLRTLFEMPTVRQLAAEIERLIVAKVEAMGEDEALRLLQ